MAAISVIKSLPPKDIRPEIHSFIKHASKPQEGDVSELVRRALGLLKVLPSSRDAVFEYLGTIFDHSTINFICELEARGKQTSNVQFPIENAVIDEIHGELRTFILTQPSAWSMIVSKWSLEVLGNLTSKYSSRGRSPVNGSLNDSLHQWLTCRATRILLDLNITCLQRLVGTEDSGNCINFLLDTCVKHNPHFDWAVAYIGNTFPEVVISRVLKCGLFDYSNNRGNTNLPKITSIVGILMHLSGSHQIFIEEAMYNLFNVTLCKVKSIEKREAIIEKNSTVPYLLHLSSLSPVLLSAFVQVVIQALKLPILNELERFGVEWAQYSGSRQALLDLVIHLTLSITEGADQLFFLLLEATAHFNTTVAETAEEILELLVKELEISIRGGTSKIPFLESIQKNVNEMFPLLLSQNEVHSTTGTTLLSFIGQQQPSLLPRCVAYVLLRSTDDEHLASVVKLTQGNESSAVLTLAISLSLNTPELTDKARVWDNITKLMKWETSGTLISLPILESVFDNLMIISNLLCNEKEVKVAHTIAKLIRKTVLQSSQQPNVRLSRSIIQANIAYFYLCLEKSDGLEEMKGLNAINLTMKKLSQSAVSSRVFALREILEAVLFRTPSVLFGALPLNKHSLIESSISLMKENTKQGHTALMGQRHSSVFHAGIIGSGMKQTTPTCPTNCDDVVHNTNLLLSVVKACCTSETNQGTLDAVISVALLLVELISPDVMYNGLPWPEEDFCKVTVERDLYIRRILDNIPVVWSLLAFIAHHRPALCYCSVILRAMIATLLGQWFSASQQGYGPGHDKKLIDTTIKIVQIMALGQLLPPPLTALGDVMPYIPPNQVVQILRDCVWNYMRDHVPSPALFTRDPNGNMWRDTSTSRPPEQYTETLRLVMLSNFSTLGALYNTLFVEDIEE